MELVFLLYLGPLYDMSKRAIMLSIIERWTTYPCCFQHFRGLRCFRPRGLPAWMEELVVAARGKRWRSIIETLVG